MHYAIYRKRPILQVGQHVIQVYRIVEQLLCHMQFGDHEVGTI